MKIEFKIISFGSEEWEKAVTLREVILRKPLGGSFSKAELDEEKKHIHIIGLFNANIVATSVLVPENNGCKMQRVVVKSQIRNQAIGSKMMHFCEKFAFEKGFNIIYCHARDSAVNFYLKNNYMSIGDYFDEDGIPHLKMIKHLT